MANLLAGIGQARPVSDFINVAGQYQMQQSSLENQRLQRQMLQQQQDQLAKDNAEYDVDAALSLYPEQDRPFIKQALTMAGKIRPDGMVIGKDMREVPQLFVQYPKVAIGRGMMEYDSLAKENEKLAKKGDEQSQQQMLANAQRMTEIKKNIASLSGKEGMDEEKITVAAPGSDVLKGDTVIHSVPNKPAPDNSELMEIRRNQQEETVRHNKEIERLRIEQIRGDKAKGGAKNELSFGDKETLRAIGKQLPKTKIAAETAVKNVQKIDRMIALIDQGAGGVRGELLAKVNKVADALRRTPPEDAKYNTLKAELRGFAGQLRLTLGLIGQTSDRDVAIMYEAAGGMSPAESQKAILQGYKQAYMQDITNYNSDAAAYSDYSEVAGKAYRPIEIQGQQAGAVTVVERRKAKDGGILEKLSDGTIRRVR